MYKAFLIKYGEIGLKGKNRHLFEDALVQQMKYALKPVTGEFVITKEQGRIYIEAMSDYDYEEVVERLSKVFGIVGICPMQQLPDEGFAQMTAAVLQHLKVRCPKQNQTFKVNARRARKNYPLTSMEINAKLGEQILAACPAMKVDVHQPDLMIHIEIRKQINLYTEEIKGLGGMPVGTNGKAMLLLSGGIDSPVAGYMIAKRGVKIDAIYFHAPPYTSERAKQKVVDLAQIVASYAGPVYLKVINFTEIQLAIYDKCPHEQLTIIMRRYMMKIAEHFARETKSLALITGESVGQVASQTMQSLAATDEVCQMPVFRPLIGFDKHEIISVAEEIGTYATSILPYEDCCTIFVAKHPVTKPNLTYIHRSEEKLGEEMAQLVQKAIDDVETIVVSPNKGEVN
jgi:thiamine biosynthesis protein ThiI